MLESRERGGGCGGQHAVPGGMFGEAEQPAL